MATNHFLYKLSLEFFDWFLQIILDIFFREVSIRGSFNLPLSGPTIVVIAPHANQYLDAAITTYCTHLVSGRQLSMIEAASSYYSKWMGIWSRWSGAIPVIRPQDLLVQTKGKIRYENYLKDPLTIVGEDTQFTRNCEVKGLLGLPRSAGNVKIGEIISDTKLKLATPMKKKKGIDALIKGTTFRVAPRIDNHNLFDKVFDSLHDGDIIGIAPEGGSHDRTELLELKPGVAIMALGAVAKYPDNTEVTIVPCGLNYFHPHKFRSRAVLEFGLPLHVTKEMAMKYKSDAKGTVNKLMETISIAMKTVTTQSPDYQTLQVIQAARRLYSYNKFQNPPLPVVVEMNRNLLIGYSKYKDDPKIVHLKKSVISYNQKLKYYGLKDHQVEHASQDIAKTLFLLLQRFLMLIFYTVLSLPGTILFSPIFIASSVISKKKQKIALARSDVKIRATDVLGSWKVLIALFFAPVCYLLYSLLGTYTVVKYNLSPLFTHSYFGVACIFVGCWTTLVATTYSAFRMGEVGMDIFKSLRPLFLSLSPASTELSKLKEERAKLSMEVTEVINELGPKVFSKFNEKHLKNIEEDLQEEQDYIKLNSSSGSRSRSRSRSRSKSRSRSSSRPELSRSSSEFSGFSEFDGDDNSGKLPNLAHVSIFPDQLQMSDSQSSSTSGISVEGLNGREEYAIGIENRSLGSKIRNAVIQRNLEQEHEHHE